MDKRNLHAFRKTPVGAMLALSCVNEGMEEKMASSS